MLAILLGQALLKEPPFRGIVGEFQRVPERVAGLVTTIEAAKQLGPHAGLVSQYAVMREHEVVAVADGCSRSEPTRAPAFWRSLVNVP